MLKELISYLYQYEAIQNYFSNNLNEYLPESYYNSNPISNLLHLVAGYDFNPRWDHLFPETEDLLITLSSGINKENLGAMLLKRIYKGIHYGKLPPEILFSPYHNIHAISGLQANHTLRATGFSRALKIYQSKGIAICSIKNNNLLEGNTLEAIQGSESEKLPIIYIVEQELYKETVIPKSDNLHTIKCDSTDILDCINASKKARNIAKNENIPVMIFTSVSEDNRLNKLLPEIENLLKLKISAEELSEIRKKAISDIKKGFEAAEKLSSPKYSQVLHNINCATYNPTEDENMVLNSKKNILEAIYDTAIKELPKHDHSFYVYRETQHKNSDKEFLSKLTQKLGKHRVISLKASNNYILGTTSGMIQYNSKIVAVVEMESSDSLLSSLNTIREMAFRSWETNGIDTPSIVLRVPTGGYSEEGPYNSSNIESMLLNIPGIRIIYPSFADDFSGLLRTAIRSKGVTIIFEPKAIYLDRIAQKVFNENITTNIGEGIIRKEGNDITFITYGNSTHLCLKVAQKLYREHDVIAEIFELRTLLPIDKTGILKSVAKTKKAIIVHEGYLFGGIGAEIAAMINKEGYDFLEAPIERSGSLFSPIPHQQILEKTVLPGIKSIYNAAFELID